jgi:hypothetical protein
MLNILASLLPGLFKLGDKMIEDKDKKAEYAFKVQEMAQTMGMKLLDTKTYPWVDALVKLSYASESIIKGLFRPIVTAGMTGFAIYCQYKGIELDGTTNTILLSAFPGWGVSRHMEKKSKPEE